MASQRLLERMTTAVLEVVAQNNQVEFAEYRELSYSMFVGEVKHWWRNTR